MLKQLTIRNYALIGKSVIDFPGGLSVITGETGAGKSIILGALALILGQRADARSIREGEDRCLIEGLFDISSYAGLEAFFAEHDWEYDPHNCLLRREIWRSGKSRAFVNDTPAGLGDLKDLGARLIDIHSQHQNLLLGDNKFQLQALDLIAGNQALQAEYRTAFLHFTSLRKQWQTLTEQAQAQATELEYLRFRFQQLDDAHLRAGEQEEQEAEAATLSHVEEIKSGLYALESLLSSDEKGILRQLNEALHTAQALKNLCPAGDEAAQRLEEAYFDLRDLLPDIVRQQEKLESDPERLQLITERLDLLYSLQQKYKAPSLDDLIAQRDQLQAQLNVIEHFDETLAALRTELAAAEAQTLQSARRLTETRAQAAGRLEQQLVAQVSLLGMPFMQFAVSLAEKAAPDATGIDDVSFLFSANRNVPVKPVAQIASGGEISRLMLGIKALMADVVALPTIIFDEIDTGVSGEVADKMGGILHRMGDAMQVVAITHLPQIAARGDSHFFVHKEENDVTETYIRRLSPEERITEIARMLSGSELTEAAVANAKELLK
jgi:DNA repair protein RecN (Recombination protein N)